jgi:hypothetical protein
MNFEDIKNEGLQILSNCEKCRDNVKKQGISKRTEQWANDQTGQLTDYEKHLKSFVDRIN